MMRAEDQERGGATSTNAGDTRVECSLCWENIGGRHPHMTYMQEVAMTADLRLTQQEVAIRELRAQLADRDAQIEDLKFDLARAEAQIQADWEERGVVFPDKLPISTQLANAHAQVEAMRGVVEAAKRMRIIGVGAMRDVINAVTALDPTSDPHGMCHCKGPLDRCCWSGHAALDQAQQQQREGKTG